MTEHWSRKLLALCALTSALTLAQAQSAKQADSFAQLPAWRQQRLAWVKEQWTGNDRPYVQIRQNIDQALRKGRKTDELLEQYKRSAQQEPSNPQKQFGWGYAGWMARKRFSDYSPQYQRIYRAHVAMLQVPSPRTYEFARLLFLMEAWSTAVPEAIEGIGQRLIRRNPNDHDVKYYLMKVLGGVPSRSAKQQALGYAQQFIRSDPKRASYRASLGAIHFRWWMRTKNKADGKNAVAAYRQAVQLSSPNDPWRKEIENIIHYIEERNG